MISSSAGKIVYADNFQRKPRAAKESERGGGGVFMRLRNQQDHIECLAVNMTIGIRHRKWTSLRLWSSLFYLRYIISPVEHYFGHTTNFCSYRKSGNKVTALVT